MKMYTGAKLSRAQAAGEELECSGGADAICTSQEEMLGKITIVAKQAACLMLDLQSLAQRREEDREELEQNGYNPWITNVRHNCRCVDPCACYKGPGGLTRREEHFHKLESIRSGKTRNPDVKLLRDAGALLKVQFDPQFEMNSELGEGFATRTKVNSKSHRHKPALKPVSHGASYSIEPARRLVGFDSIPILTVAQRSGKYVRGMVRVSQINGANGEATGTDDLAQPESGFPGLYPPGLDIKNKGKRSRKSPENSSRGSSREGGHTPRSDPNPQQEWVKSAPQATRQNRVATVLAAAGIQRVGAYDPASEPGVDVVVDAESVPPSRLPDDLAAHRRTHAEPFCLDLTVSSRGHIVGLHNSRQVFRNFGADVSYVSPGTIVRCVVMDAGVVLYGVHAVHEGYYEQVDLPKEIKTLEECLVWEQAYGVTIVDPITWVNIPPIDLPGTSTIKPMRIGGDFVIKHATVFGYAQRYCTANKPDTSVYASLIAIVTKKFPTVSADVVVGSVKLVMWQLTQTMLLLMDKDVQVVSLIASRQPNMQKQVRDMVHGADHIRAVTLAGSTFALAHDGPRWYASFAHRLLSHPLADCRQGFADRDDLAWQIRFKLLTEAARFTHFPRDTCRFKLHASRGRNIVFLPRVDDPNNPEDLTDDAWFFPAGLQIAMRDVVAPENAKSRYRLVGTRYLPVHANVEPDNYQQSDPVVWTVGPSELCAAMNKRVLQALPDEDEMLHNQLMVIWHIRHINKDIGDRMVHNIIRLGNNSRAMEEFFLQDRFDEEQSLKCFTSSLHHSTMHRDNEFLAVIGRRSAAIAILARLDRMDKTAARTRRFMTFIACAVTIVYSVFIYHVLHSWGGGPLNIFIAAIPPLLALAAYNSWQLLCSKVGFITDSGTYYHTLPYSSNGHWKFLAVMLQRPHPKLKLYLRMFMTNFMGIDVQADPTGIYFGPTAVALQQKPDEIAKPGKCPRVVGACGRAVLQTLGWASDVKHAYAGVVHFSRDLACAFTFPVPHATHNVCAAMPATISAVLPPGVAFHCDSFSDDEFAALHSIAQRTVMVCADASSADSSVGPGILLGILPATYSAVGAEVSDQALVSNFVGPWEAIHPHDRKSSVTYMPTIACMPSGDANTTHLQNIFTTLRVAAFWGIYSYQRECHSADARDRISVADQGGEVFDEEQVIAQSIAVAARSVGGISTVEIGTKPQSATFLKRFIVDSISGKECYITCLGTIFRGWLTHTGEFEAKMFGVSESEFRSWNHSQKWDRYARGIVAGLKNEPSSLIIDALRARYPPSSELFYSNRDLAYKQECVANMRDNSAEYVGLSEFEARYGGSSDEWEGLARAISQETLGVAYLRLPIINRLLAVDYGFAY